MIVNRIKTTSDKNSTLSLQFQKQIIEHRDLYYPTVGKAQRQTYHSTHTTKRCQCDVMSY